MNGRTARLRAHHQNIERYQSLLKTELGEVELQYLERRLPKSVSQSKCLWTQALFGSTTIRRPNTV